MVSVKRNLKRIMIGISGGLILLVGIIAIPYPGPGWLIVFAGLALLATEFDWARQVLDKLRGQYDRWQTWLRLQPRYVRLLVGIATGLVVVLTIYLLNGYGLLDNWLHLGMDWVHSPLPIFS